MLIFAMSSKDLQKHVERRAGQCVLTCPTTAAYNGIRAEVGKEWLNLGASLRYFGDGFQISKLIDGKRYWRIPVMEGEFVCEEKAGLMKSIGGGNFLILARDERAACAAAERAVGAMRKVRKHHCRSRRSGALGLTENALSFPPGRREGEPGGVSHPGRECCVSWPST
jgi:formylmethanofuran--tetrahydromethanopterin N-formyltransferase